MMKRRFVLGLMLAALLAIYVIPAHAGSTTSARDTYDRLVESFDYGEYAKVIHIYETELMALSPLEQYDSSQYYFFAKAQYAVFQEKDYAAAILYLESLPDGFKQVVQFRGYVNGLNAEALAKTASERGMHEEAFAQYSLAREYFTMAEGLYDSVIHLVNLPTPTPMPEQTPQPIVEIAAPAPISKIPASSVSGEWGIGIVTIQETLKNGVNVRAEPDQNAEMVGYVPMFTSYICLSVADNGWKEILLPTGVTGFVSGKLVDYEPNEAGVGSRSTYSESIGTVQVLSGKIRTYASTSYDSDFMGSISAGIDYPCVEININGGWCCIATTGNWLVYAPMDSTSFTPYYH